MNLIPNWAKDWEPYAIPGAKSNFYLTVDEAIDLFLNEEQEFNDRVV